MKVEHEVDDGSFESCAHALVDGESCSGDLARSFEVEDIEIFAYIPVRLGLKAEFTRFAPLAELHIGCVVSAFLDLCVRNVRHSEQDVSEFFLDLSDFAVKLLDACGKLLHLLEELGRILALFLQLRHLARSNVLLVLESLYLSEYLSPLNIEFLHFPESEIALAASFDSCLNSVKIFSYPFDIQHFSLLLFL